MNISQNGVNLIKSFEGFEAHPYRPVSGEKYLTIGYGHYGADVREGMTVTEAQAERLLVSDLATFVAGVNDLVKVPVNQNQFDALVSFAYNCGLQALKGSTLLSDVNKKEFTQAAQEFGKWVHDANHGINQGLVNRRKKEAELFSKPLSVEKTVPPKPAAQPKPLYHVVKPGENLTVIAKNNGLTLAEVEALNKGINYNVIQPGQNIRIK